MSDKGKSQVEKEIMTAIELCGSEGASLDDIQRHLKSNLKNNVPDLESLQSGLNKAVAKELLLELDNGKYKIKGSAKQAEATSEGTNMADNVLSNLYREDNGIKETTRCAKENAKEAECFDDKVAQDANRNTDSDTKNAGTSMAEKDTNVSLPDGNDRALSKLNKLHLKDNETKATGRRAEDNAQEVKRPLDKVTQDANRNADSVTGNVSSSLTKEDAKVSLPDDYDEVVSKLNDLRHKDNETKATGRCAEGNAQEVKRPLDKGTQDANRTADSVTGNVGSSLTKEDAKVSLPDDCDEVLSNLNDLYHKDNETKTTGRRAEENSQDGERSVDKVTQDTDRNADSDKGRALFSVTEKDANIPLPDDGDKIDKKS